MSCEPRNMLAARTRVLNAFKQGHDWLLVAHHNATPPTTARRIVTSGSPEIKARGGARASNVKCTPKVEAALVDYIEENCLYTLVQLQRMVVFDFGVSVSTSLISQKLCGKLYTLKQTRIDPVTCNSGSNIEKRRVFAETLLRHELQAAARRALQGERAVVKLPASKGKNLQVQCAVSTEIGLVHYATQRGSIKMETNAAFVDANYATVKAHETCQTDFSGKPIVIVLDNAPAHSQTEDLLRQRSDLVLLRLGPYSPMCNPVEGFFSVLKAKIKSYLALSHDEMLGATRGQMQERRMQLPEKAAENCMPYMTLRTI